MRLGARAALAALALLLTVGGVAPARTQEVPLAEVWALDMPGTRPMSHVRRGDPLAYDAPEGPLVDDIVRALGDRPRDAAGACFAVAGTGMEALRAAHAVLVGGRAAATSFRPGEPLTVVFYSRPFGAYVHLVSARRRGGALRLSYRFVPHKTREVTTHLALVPLSAPTRGRVRVEVAPAAETPAAGSATSREEREAPDARAWGRRVVCAPFAFDVAPA